MKKSPGVLCATRTLLVLITAATAFAVGPDEVDYRYRRSWSEEETGEQPAVLLLHFGPPRVLEADVKRSEATIKRKVGEEQEAASTRAMERFFDDLGSGRDLGGGVAAEMLGQDAAMDPIWRPKEIDESKLAPDQVADYSDHRKRYTIGPGTMIVDAGKFGRALRCDGTGAMVCEGISYTRASDGSGWASGTSFISFWMKTDAYPTNTVCVLEILGAEGERKVHKNTGGGRILLHPDGILELRLRQRHGHPGANSMGGKAAVAEFLKTAPSYIASIDPIPLGEWIKVKAYNDEPVVQGPNCFRAGLAINNERQADYLGPQGNHYFFNGRHDAMVVIGNNVEMNQGFAGLIDEVLVSRDWIGYIPEDPMLWRDLKEERSVGFGKPYFYKDGAVFHASLGDSRAFQFHEGGAKQVDYVPEQQRKALTVPGVRGHAWRIDPLLAFPRFSLQGLSSEEASLEFWFRPENFDNFTRVTFDKERKRWSPPHPRLSMMRIYGREKGADKETPFIELAVWRGREGGGPAIHPGKWWHVVVRWSNNEVAAYLDGKPWRNRAVLTPAEGDDITLSAVEFGVRDNVLVKGGQFPRIEIDEVAGYSYALHPAEIAYAQTRWMEEAGPIPMFSVRSNSKRRIGKMNIEIATQFPPDKTPGTARVSVFTPDNELFFGPAEQPVEENKASIRFAMDGPIPKADYTATIEITDETGNLFTEGTSIVDLTPPPVYAPTAGVLDAPPPPWTPIRFEDNRVETRMTSYVLGPDGLPKEIVAKGKNLLARPAQITEDGRPLKGSAFERVTAQPVEAAWKSVFKGTTCDIEALWSCDYDGCVKYTLTLRPRGKVAPIAVVFPIRADRATRWMRDFANGKGMHTGVVPTEDGTFLGSRDQAYWAAKRRAQRDKEKPPTRDEVEGYGFMNVMDVNDMDRGFYWFADNAAGWWQSPGVPAQTMEKRGDEVVITCQLVAEPVDGDKLDRRPIVFGVLPHPARPVASYYRKLDRERSREFYSHAYKDVFVPWVVEPRDNTFRVWPKLGRYDLAERARDARMLSGKNGSWMMYHSWYWMGFRGGGPDYWEMMSDGHPTFTPDLVDHLCWEWNEWVRRGIYDGWYADEDYSSMLSNVEAGFAVRLPDGAIQRGEPFWGKRDFTKRSRNISHQHGKPPMLLVHGTGSFNYSNLIFADSFLDGEGRGGMIGGAQAPGFMRSTALHRLETIQNGSLWGIVPAWYACIWEKGKEASHKRWAWRMARECNALLAHYECFAAYCETSSVFSRYWNDVLSWGAGDPEAVPFVPYWRLPSAVSAEGVPDNVLVSYYHGKGKLLLLASNRTSVPRDVRIRLKPDELGLPAELTATRLDSTFQPREGEDFLSAEEKSALQKKLMRELDRSVLPDDVEMTDEEVDDFLEDPEQKKKEEDLKFLPRIEDGNVLVVRIRPKDFQLVSIE